MKVSLACKSILLTKSLEIFLKKNISSYKKCDFVISDRKLEIDKPLFLISDKNSNLQMPFSESSLMIALDKFYIDLTSNKNSNSDLVKNKKDNLREKVDFLTKKFRDDLIEIIEQHYEKK